MNTYSESSACNDAHHCTVLWHFEASYVFQISGLTKALTENHLDARMTYSIETMLNPSKIGSVYMYLALLQHSEHKKTNMLEVKFTNGVVIIVLFSLVWIEVLPHHHFSQIIHFYLLKYILFIFYTECWPMNECTADWFM